MPAYPETLPREVRRARGVYYTPEPIVRHVVHRTLGPVMARAGRSTFPSAPRILDPAMGDGAFLLEAAELAGGASSLAGIDIDPHAVRRARERLPRAHILLADALAETLPDGIEEEGFDAVLGNPPWGGWSRRLEPGVKRSYRLRFETARGLLEPSVLFLERASKLLAPGGRLGMVLPDFLLLKNYPAARRRLLDLFEIEELVHWGAAFRGVNLDAFSLVARRRRPRGSHRVRCLPQGPEGRVVRTPQSRFSADPACRFNLFLDDAGAALLERIRRRGVPLGDWAETHEGIHSGNVRARLFLPPGVAGPRVDRDPSLRPLLFGRKEIRPFGLAPAGWRVVYDPRVVRRQKGEYANLGNSRWFESPKLLVRRTGDRVVAASDRTGLYAGNNLFVVLRRRGCPVPLSYLEGYLNSWMATWCFRAVQPRVGRLFAELKLEHLNALPVPPPRDRSDIDRVGRLVRRLRRLAATGAATTAAGGRTSVDALFTDMAGLDPGEIRLAESRFPSSAHSL